MASKTPQVRNPFIADLISSSRQSIPRTPDEHPCLPGLDTNPMHLGTKDAAVVPE